MAGYQEAPSQPVLRFMASMTPTAATRTKEKKAGAAKGSITEPRSARLIAWTEVIRLKSTAIPMSRAADGGPAEAAGRHPRRQDRHPGQVGGKAGLGVGCPGRRGALPGHVAQLLPRCPARPTSPTPGRRGGRARPPRGERRCRRPKASVPTPPRGGSQQTPGALMQRIRRSPRGGGAAQDSRECRRRVSPSLSWAHLVVDM